MTFDSSRFGLEMFSSPACGRRQHYSVHIRVGNILAAVLIGISLSSLGCTDKSNPTETPSKNSNNQSLAEPNAVIKVDFADITKQSMLKSTYDNGEKSEQYSIAESLGGGVGSIDYDNDGRSDLFFPAGGQIELNQPLSGLPSKLFRNLGQEFVDVSVFASVDLIPFYSHGVTSADVDNDGFSDILVTGYGGIQLLLNCGDGTFRDGTAFAKLAPIHWATSSGWGDFDADGNVDLYVTQYCNWSWSNNPKCSGGGKDKRDVCTPQSFSGIDDVLFWNNGDGTFTRDSGTAGLLAEGKGLGVIVFDVNYDSKPDIYVANDTTNNFLYLNLGGRKFKESGVISATAFDNMGVPNGSMGLAVFDYDNDQKCDLFVTNYERETFAVYRNDGKANFRHVSERTGITALGRLFVGFGTTSGDFSLNGREDLVVANGHVMRYPNNGTREQEPLYIQNRADGKLVRGKFDPASFFAGKICGRGVIATDLNTDGKLDLVFSNVNEPAIVLRNETATNGNWISLNLVGVQSNRNAIGAKIELETTARILSRQVIGGGSYLSQGPYHVHFGIPAGESVKSCQVEWPSGLKQSVSVAELNRGYLIVEAK